MKKIVYIFLITILMFCISGCKKEENKINTDSKIAVAKKNMMESLDNYSYDIELTTKTGIMDIKVNMKCKEDIKNKVSYCLTSTYGVKTEEYIDYENQKNYSKVTTAFGENSDNDKWTTSKYSGENTNTWINLNDYIFNLTEEKQENGTYYKGTIDSKKLVNAILKINSDIDISKVVNDDIEVNVFVNSSNYIEKMSCTIKVMGIEEELEINYKDFNTSGDIVIPTEITQN